MLVDRSLTQAHSDPIAAAMASYLEQLSSALVPPIQQQTTIAATSAAAAAIAPLSHSFPPPPPIAPAPAISAANPFTFLPRAPVAAAVAPPPLPSFNAEFTRITLEQKAAEAAREVAVLQAARKAAAAQADEALARSRAAKRLLAQARPAAAGASAARPIDLDTSSSSSSAAAAAAASGELLSELELRDAADPNPEDDPNDAPIPSNFNARRIRDPKAGVLPPRKSEWSLRQTLMSKRPAPASSSQPSRAPQTAASVGSKTATQSRWVAKGLQADEAQAAARKKVRAEAAMKQASVIVGDQRAGIKPLAASTSSAAAAAAASRSSSFAVAASRSSAASPSVPTASVASKLKRKQRADDDDDDVEEVIDLRGELKNKKPKVKPAPAAASASSSSAAAATAAAASKSVAPVARSVVPKKQITGSGFTAAFTAIPAAAAASAPPAAAPSPPQARPVTVPVIPLPRTSLCAIPVSVRQLFVDAMFSLCCIHHPTQFDREEMHPSLPSNALLLRLEFEMLQKTIRVHPTDAPGTTAAIAAAAGDAQLRTYRESTAIVLQLMRDEKDLVAVSRIVAQS